MDKNKYSAIAHQHHSIFNPLPASKIDKIIKLLSLHASDNVIDIGSGKGEILLRIIERYKAKCTAIEQFEGYAEKLRLCAGKRGILKKIDIIQEDAKEAIKSVSKPFHTGICIGASHALGGYRKTIEALTNLVEKGGYIVIGELYWRKHPDEEYLKGFGAKEKDLLSHAENIFTAEEYGLTPVWAATASEDDWDCYEWQYSKSIEDYCFHHPEDPDSKAMLEKIRSWRRLYLKWGRDTLGFGLYLFKKKSD
ncbi:SAM-dependent methyltransferase [Metabacillus sp. RGM 3146]|uniref:SAM-dependent methyltransferase n=1 Tax=Metabacillus sp. RGM 3146 TaxID=3401092 RepID=UPI003B9C597E